MINKKIVEALCAAPEAVPVDDEVTITAQDQVDRALLRYGADALRAGLLAGHPNAPSKPPFQVILSLVVEGGHGQLRLLCKPDPQGKLNRQDLAEIRDEENFTLIESLIANRQDRKRFHHVEAIISDLNMSSHAKLRLAARMNAYQALI